MAPYFMQTFWNAAIERTSAICAMKLVMPSGRKRLMSGFFRVKLFFVSLIVLMCARYQTERAAVSI